MESVLSPEQWQQILEFVPPMDLRNVVIASRQMNSLASWPDLWATMKVNMGKLKENRLAQLYNINRFNRIKRMDFADMDLVAGGLEGLFEDVPESPLDNMTISWAQFGEASEEALANVVEHLQTLTVKRPPMIMTTEALVKLENVLQSAKGVLNLDLSGVHFMGVPGDLLARIIKQLSSVDMRSTHLTTNQWHQVLKASINSTTLVDVNLALVSLSRIEADLLAGAVKRLQKVNLHYTYLTTEQSTEVVKAIISSTTLVDVGLRGVDLRSIRADLLAGAIRRLHKVSLSYTLLTTEQLTEVFKDFDATLVDVDLSNVNLRSVQADLLADAVRCLRKVKLNFTRLTSEQCTEVVKAIISSTTLEDVELVGNDIDTKVPASLLNCLPGNVAHY